MTDLVPGQRRELEEALRQRLGRLSPEKRALLESRLSKRSRVEPAPVIRPRSEPGPTPLSYMQELLWLVQELDRNAIVYNTSVGFALHGPLDVEALGQAFTALVDRHEVLRTTFRVIDGRPMAIVGPPPSSMLDHVDLIDIPEHEREREMVRLIDEQLIRPFDLERGPMLHATLFRLGPEEHAVYMIGHHIAWDGWSKGIMYRELSADYAAFAAGTESAVSVPEIQYADFAVWQRKWLAQGTFDHQLEYWRQQLAGAPALLELPTDRPRPHVQTHPGRRHSLWMPNSLLEEVQAFGQERGGTLFMTLLAGFNVLLQRYSGQDDILVGTPVAGRNRTEIEDLIGYFTNTLVLRTDCSGEPTFAEFFKRARDSALGAFENQDAPLERLIQELRPDRNPSHSPFFQVLFILQNLRPTQTQSGTALPPTAPELPGIKVERLLNFGEGGRSAKFDLSVGIGTHPEGLHASFEYNTDLFDAETIDRMGQHYATLLEDAVRHPETPISRLRVLSDVERSQLLVDWNPSPIPQADTPLLHELFERSAVTNPNAAALEAGDVVLTYADLDQRATRLAARLLREGVEYGDAVGVHLGRTPDFPVSVLATLKAGGAVLPLDPTYPRARLAQMIADAGAKLVLSDGERAASLGEGAWRVVRVDAEQDIAEPIEAVECQIEPDDVAYILFTSGSTGTPRGVELTHRGLAAHAVAAAEAYKLEADDRVLQFASISFDISLEELFPTWSVGGTVVLRPDDLPIFGVEFVEWLERRRITALDLPTAYWHEWVDDLSRLNAALPSSLRTLIVGGEKALAGPYRRWLELPRAGGVRWFNTYGPTETSVVASLCEPPRVAEEVPAQLPIGRPFGETRLYVLDAKLEPVPIGVRGELYIGGTGVARGYRDDPEKTRAKFVADPFAGDPAARMYASGDVVRYGRDGNLQFVGRADDQIKIRGFRIEPAEVTAALERHPKVHTSVVTAHAGANGSPKLAAYVQAASADASPSAADLRVFLADQLPAHMIPSAFVVLESLPLNANGKVDRSALPDPDGHEAGARGSTPPRDEIERGMVEIWKETLELEEAIGIEDDFFDLGGHSLVAVRLFAEIERTFGKRLPLALLFQGSTVEHLAAAVRDERALEWPTLVPLRAEGTKPPLFLFHGIDGAILFYRGLARHLGPDQPVYAVQPQALDGQSRPHTSVQSMAAEYVAELRRFYPGGPYLVGGHCFSGVLAYEVARQLMEAGESTPFVAVIDGAPVGLAQPSRLELERVKFRDFAEQDLRGKAAWLSRRARGLLLKVRKRSFWLFHDALVRTRIPIPSRFLDVRAATARARKAYVTPTSACKITLFRAEIEMGNSFERISMWNTIAHGGVDIRPVRGGGVRHDNIMEEPYVQVLADEMTAALASVHTADVEPKREVA